MRSVDLRQVHVTEGRLDVADDRPLRDHLLSLADHRHDVEVLEDDVRAGIDVQRRGAQVVRRPAHHRVDRRAVGSGDVDALVK